jgi:hypothetical protein
MVLGYLVFKEDLFAIKGALIRALVSTPEPERESSSLTQAQLDDLGVNGVLRVLSGCARAHPPDVAPELVSELTTRSRDYMCDCSRCSPGTPCRCSHGCRGKCGSSSGLRHFG